MYLFFNTWKSHAKNGRSDSTPRILTLLNILGWRTCAIIEDLETEIEIANNPVTKFKVSWSNTLQGLLDTYQGTHQMFSRFLNLRIYQKKIKEFSLF